MIIGGRSCGAADGAVQEVVSPATHEVVDTVPRATPEDLARALAHARRGFAAWSRVPLHRRIEVVQAFERRLEERREDLVRLSLQEAGKTRALAAGELRVAGVLLRNFCEAARALGGRPSRPATTPSRSTTWSSPSASPGASSSASCPSTARSRSMCRR